MASAEINTQLHAGRRTSSLLHRFRTKESPIEAPGEAAKLGLYEISNNISCPVATIIFIHGLGGHPVKTWRNSAVPNSFWPKDWLPHEPGLEMVRICVFGYSAEFATTKESSSTIAEFSKRLNFDITVKEMADAPIFFVAHSMGGLVVKKAYMMAKQDKTYNVVAECIKAMVFIGTPHRGSDAASTLHTFLSTTIGSKPFVKELKTKSSSLDAINEEFRYYAESLGLWSLYETLSTPVAPGRRVKIVDKESAVLGYSNEQNIDLPGDHRTMIKFNSKDDEGYNVLRNLIQHMLKKYCSQARPPDYQLISPSTQNQKGRSQVMKRLTTILGQEDTNEDNLLFFRDHRLLSQSCMWIYNKEAYKWWYDENTGVRGRYLWLNGLPAAGKSVLMSAVVDKLQTEGRICAYYFFRSNNTAQRTTKTFILSLISQMASQIPLFYQKLSAIDAGQTSVQMMSIRVLWQRVFVNTLFEMELSSKEPWYWLIDALDEAEEPKEVASLIAKITSHTPINVLVTSRPGMEIQRSLQAFVPKDFLRQEQIDASDTREDMICHATHRLRLASLPFESGDIDHIVSLIVEKSQGIFLWLECALDAVLSTVFTLDTVPEALAGVPSDMTAFLECIVENMSQKPDSNKKIAKAILQNLVCAMRPLTEKELKATLTPEFGQMASLEYTVKQVCPHLIRIRKTNQGDLHFQLIHEIVREFLLDSVKSEFGIDSSKGHRQLALVCLHIWSGDTFFTPISSSTQQPRSADEMDKIHPLLRYSATSWFDHVQKALIDKDLETSIRRFLRAPVLSWVEAVGLLNDVSLLTLGALALETCVLQPSLISIMDQKLISGWAVDLMRMGPQYGRDITAHPFSIHKLLPPFFPRNTQIGSQFGGVGAIAITGIGLKGWDDCLAHIPVGQNGEACRFLVCGDSLLAIGLSGVDGSVVLYDSETCQELQKLQHGERLGAMNINSTGESLVTGGVRSLKIWDTKTGKTTHELKTTAGSRCLAVSFKAGSKSVASFTSDDALRTWDFHRNITQCIRWKRPATGDRYRGSACSAVFAKDATKLNLAYKGWPLEIWDIEKMVLTGAIATPSPVSSCYNPCNEDVYALDNGGSIFHLAMEFETVTKMASDACIVACNTNGTLVATGNANGVLKIYAADTMELLCKLDKYTGSIKDICFNPDGRRLFDIRSSECNVWVPEALLASIREEKSIGGTRSENSSFGSTPKNVALESSRALVTVTALASDSTGSYICCGKSNGAIFIHGTESGRQLQFLYNHDITVNIETITWSANGSFIASGDNSGRIIVAGIQAISSTKWSCVIKLDFTLDQHLDGGIRQLLMDSNCSSILVSSQGSHRMLNIEDGKDIGQRQVYDGNFTPWWLNHPFQQDRLILFEPENAKVYTWAEFKGLTTGAGIKLKSAHSPSTWIDRLVRMRAFATQDGQRIVTEWSTGDRGKPTQTSYWDTTDFNTESEIALEAGNWNNLVLNGVVGIYRNQAVFLDRDLWLCSSTCSRNGDTIRHFYMPMDWLNTTESRLSLMTRSGEFVYAKHGEVIIVKCGMRSNQGSI